MEVGRVGVHGVLAVKTVEKANKTVHEVAKIQRLAMVDYLVLDHLSNLKRASG